MRAITICCLLGVLCSSLLSGQETFNRRYHFDFPATVFTGLEVTDSFFLATGIITDSVFPYLTSNIFVKMDHAGELIQLNTIRSSTKEYGTWANFLEKTLDQHFLACGYSFDSLLRILLIKYNKNGETQWIREYENFGDQNAFVRGDAIMVDTDNSILIGSAEAENVSSIGRDIVVTKLTNSGDIIWRHRYPLESSDWDYTVHSLAKLTSGEYVIGCEKSNHPLVDEDFKGQCYILGLDSLGTLLWQYYSPVWLPDWRLVDGANAMVATADGGLVVASGRGEEVYVNPNSGSIYWKSAYVFKLDSGRNKEWEIELTEPGYYSSPFNFLSKMIAAEDGSGFLVTGVYTELLSNNTGDENGWLFKISPEGEKLWSRKLRYLTVGHFNDRHELYDLAETPDGGFLLAGQVKDDSLYEHYQQAWLIKVDEHGCLVPGCHLVGVEEEPGVAQPEVQVMLSPNPAREYVNVFIKDERIAQRRGAQVRVFDSQGRERLRRPAGRLDEVTNMIPVWDWPGGWYVLVYEDAGGVLWEARFVVGE